MTWPVLKPSILCLQPHSSAVIRRHPLRGNALVADVYRRHPWYATRSEIADKVLTDCAEVERIHQARPDGVKAGLFTIGYEGKSLEAYLNQLLRAGVTTLCDVRRNPLSRKYGFSKGTLSQSCERVGIRYEHLPQLGIASEERRDLKTQADYDALFAEYERESTLQVLDWEAGQLFHNCFRDAHRNEDIAVAKVRQKYFDTFLQTDLHFFLGTMKEFHG